MIKFFFIVLFFFQIFVNVASDGFDLPADVQKINQLCRSIKWSVIEKEEDWVKEGKSQKIVRRFSTFTLYHFPDKRFMLNQKEIRSEVIPSRKTELLNFVRERGPTPKQVRQYISNWLPEGYQYGVAPVFFRELEGGFLVADINERQSFQDRLNALENVKESVSFEEDDKKLNLPEYLDLKEYEEGKERNTVQCIPPASLDRSPRLRQEDDDGGEGFSKSQFPQEAHLFCSDKEKEEGGFSSLREFFKNHYAFLATDPKKYTAVFVSFLLTYGIFKKSITDSKLLSLAMGLLGSGGVCFLYDYVFKKTEEKSKLGNYLGESADDNIDTGSNDLQPQRAQEDHNIDTTSNDLVAQTEFENKCKPYSREEREKQAKLDLTKLWESQQKPRGLNDLLTNIKWSDDYRFVIVKKSNVIVESFRYNIEFELFQNFFYADSLARISALLKDVIKHDPSSYDLKILKGKIIVNLEEFATETIFSFYGYQRPLRFSYGYQRPLRFR